MASWRSDLNLKTLVAKQMSMYIPHLIDIFNKPELNTEKMRMPNLFSDDVVYRDGYTGPDYLPYNFQERFSTERFSKSYVEDIEKQVEEQSRSASSFPLSSYTVTQSAPANKRVSEIFGNPFS